MFLLFSWWDNMEQSERMSSFSYIALLDILYFNAAKCNVGSIPVFTWTKLLHGTYIFILIWCRNHLHSKATFRVISSSSPSQSMSHFIWWQSSPISQGNRNKESTKKVQDFWSNALAFNFASFVEDCLVQVDCHVPSNTVDFTRCNWYAHPGWQCKILL